MLTAKKITSFVAVLLLAGIVRAQINGSDYAASNGNVKQFSSFGVQVQPDAKNAAINLYVSNPLKKNLQVMITHQVDGLLVDTLIHSEEYNQRYLFAEARDGQYHLVIRCGKEIVKRDIQLNTITTRNISVNAQ